MPSPPSTRKIATFTTAPTLGTHLETCRRTTPMATVIQVMASAMPVCSQVAPGPSCRLEGRCARRKIEWKVPANTM